MSRTKLLSNNEIFSNKLSNDEIDLFAIQQNFHIQNNINLSLSIAIKVRSTSPLCTFETLCVMKIKYSLLVMTTSSSAFGATTLPPETISIRASCGRLVLDCGAVGVESPGVATCEPYRVPPLPLFSSQ